MKIRAQVFSLVAVLLVSLAGVLIRSNADKVKKGLNVSNASNVVPIALVFGSAICGGLAFWSLIGEKERETPQQSAPPLPRDPQTGHSDGER